MYVLSLKIVSIFVILSFGFVGVSIPGFINSSNISYSEIVFLLCKVFSAGIILGTGTVHMFPESQNLITDAYPDIDYPISGFVVGISCIFLMAIEQLINKFFHKSKETHNALNNSLSNSHSSESLYKSFGETNEMAIINTHPHKHDDTHKNHCHTVNVIYQEDPSLKKLITVYILELGIAIHSIIIGISLGATNNSTTLIVLLIAMSLHQLFEGLALGSSIVKAEINDKCKILSMMLFFSATTPTGILIGTIISESYDTNSNGSKAIQGILNAVSAGVLIYMALIHLIIEDFKNNEINDFLKFLMFVSIILGYCVMSVMAIWS